MDSLPQKPTMLATMKSTNYLLNSLVASHAERKGGCMGIQVNDKGMLAEGSVCNVAFVLKVQVRWLWVKCDYICTSKHRQLSTALRRLLVVFKMADELWCWGCVLV